MTLKALRIKKHLTQEKASRLLGFSKGYLSRLENGQKKVNVETAIRMSALYCVSVESILRASGYVFEERHICVVDEENGLIASIKGDEVIELKGCKVEIGF